ncbi:hypothetical protein [Hyalangium gracile]|uniref:hypothetical protein n=1 Tax=Hyalangium gracile TaxID=394092 RepID=UPI001CCA5300|nr:hypothetical protein [Hyalangium gracile]
MAVDADKRTTFDKLSAHRDTLSRVQADMVAAAPPEQRPFLESQFKLENETQVTEMLTKLLKEDTRMTIMRNLA